MLEWYHLPSYPCSWLHPRPHYSCDCRDACACPYPCYDPRACTPCTCPNPCSCPILKYDRGLQELNLLSIKEERTSQKLISPNLLAVVKYVKELGIDKYYDYLINYEKRDIENIIRNPIKVKWDITYKCNLKCPHCYLSSAPDAPLGLDTEKVFDALEILKQNNIKTIQYLGGEPFVRKDFVDILEYTDKLGLEIEINTNGTLLNEHIIKRLSKLDKLIAIQIGLDGLRRTHDAFRGAQIFDIVINNIKLLKKYLDERVVIGIATVLRPDILDELDQFFNLLEELKVDYVQLLTIAPAGRGVKTYKKYSLQPNQIEDIVKVIEKHMKKGKILIDPVGIGFTYFDLLQVNMQNNILKMKRIKPIIVFGCEAGYVSLSMDPLGNVHLCPHIPKEHDIYLNIFEHEFNYIVRKLRSHKNKILMKANITCYKCKYYGEFCLGACPVKPLAIS